MKEFVEKLIERLEEEVFSAELHDYGWEGQTLHNLLVLGNVQVIAEDLASEHNNGWISVEDELPPRNESVLCWAVSLARGGDCCCLGSCDNGFWFMQTQIDTYSFPQQYEVVAWQNLPAPYKKGE